MSARPNKWIEKEAKKKKLNPKDTSRSNEPSKCHLNLSRANRFKTLQGVRK